jgi:transcriptional regulator with XRE-family HTH domain
MPAMPAPAPARPGRRRPRPLLRSALGDVLRRTRLAQRRTLADVAAAARVSVPYLSEVERGRKEASSEVLAAICDALATDLSDVLTEVGRDLAAVPAAEPVADRARRAPVVPLDAVRARRPATAAPPVAGAPVVSSAPRTGGGVLCLAA